MKKYKRIFAALLAAVLLLGIAPAYAGSVSTTGGLNGDVCDLGDFNYGIYDCSIDVQYAGQYPWPASGNVVIIVNGSHSFSEMFGIIIPPRLVVDVYEYHTSGKYVLLARYDTTDGQRMKVGADGKADGIGSLSFPDPVGKPLDHYSHSYDDVQPDDWYYDAVMVLTEGGLFQGCGNGKFNPNDPITYGQFQLVVSRLTGGRMYGDESGISLNTDRNKIVMSRGLTAVELIDTFRYHYSARYRNVNNVITAVDDFPDSENIRAWAYEYLTVIEPALGIRSFIPDMQASVEAVSKNFILRSHQLGLFNGVDDKGTFAPYQTLTRAQFCQVLYNVGWLTADCEYFMK